jgi:D-3-phosphoglycerate dehydrogenase
MFRERAIGFIWASRYSVRVRVENPEPELFRVSESAVVRICQCRHQGVQAINGDGESRLISAVGGEFIDAESLPLQEALRLCRETDGILCRRLEITAAMIQGFSRCKILVRYGVGTDNVDVDAATAAGIIVGHVPSYCIDEVSTHAIALLLACVGRDDNM